MNKKKIILWILLDVLLLGLIGLEIFVLINRQHDGESGKTSGEESVMLSDSEEKVEEITITEIPKITPTPEPTATPVPTLTPGLSELETILNERIESCQERVSVYVKDLSGDGVVDHKIQGKQKAASLIKLYVMAAVYDCISRGTLEETEEINQLLWDMITVSDNESTNELVRRLSNSGTSWEEGSAVVNQYISSHGYADTYMGRDVQDWRETPPPGENYTSSADCGKILEEIYRGQCVNSEYSEKMLNLLKNQTRTGKIPQGVGSTAYVANKTGELSDVENDAAIICLDDGRAYILCVMTDYISDSGTAVADIVHISTDVYNYFA